MPLFTVYYARTLPSNPFETAKVFVEADYAVMGTFSADTLSRSVADLQAERVDTEFLARCRAHGVHASMSTGDVALDEAGRYWLAEFAGYKVIPEQLVPKET